MKTLVLAEKPSVGRDLARVLGCNNKNRSYCEGSRYVVTWAMGHLIELADPGDYKEAWKSWKLESLPMLPERMKLKVIGKTSGQFRQIKALFQRKDIDSLVVATDAGREGELVARLIMRLGGWKNKSFKRLWISSQTDVAIRKGFAELSDGRKFDSLMRAAECRAEADWLVGLNVSRALTCHYDSRLSAGRVQTPTLGMMVDREEEIHRFKPRKFGTLHTRLELQGQILCTAQVELEGKNRFFEMEKGEALRSILDGGEARVKEFSIKEELVPPPLAFDLTELQREANRQLNFSAKRTLQVLQKLYEQYKIVTYPRTDSRHLTSDMKDTLKDRLKPLAASRYKEHARDLLKRTLNPGKRLIDDGRVSDHHAIVPTGENPDLQRMSAEERSLWDLIARRYIAVLMPPARIEKIKLVAECREACLRYSGKRTKNPGWQVVEGGGAVTDFTLKNSEGIREGTVLKINSTELRNGQTKPPSRYTEATLLTGMENSGLGTPATRADIIEKLIRNYSIERKGSELVPTSAGIELIRLVPGELKLPALTARWESRLKAIEKGQEQAGIFSKDIRKMAGELVEKVKASAEKFEPRNLNGDPCPMCGKPMIQTAGPRGSRIKACISFSCGYEEQRDRNGQRQHSRREKAMNRKLIKEFSSQGGETMSLGDLLKKQMEGR